MINKIIQFFTGVVRYGAVRSSEWSTVRARHLKRFPFCEVCGKKPEVHHIKPFSLHPELELDPNNLISLCKEHHLLFGHLMSWRSFNSLVVNDSFTWQTKIKSRK